MPEKAADNTLRICHYANVNFTGFFVGKIIDSAIIGVITFVAMTILVAGLCTAHQCVYRHHEHHPGVRPFIGAIPSIIFILLLVDLIQAVIFGVPILSIQQLDGKLPIGPEDPGRPVHRHFRPVDLVLHRGGR